MKEKIIAAIKAKFPAINLSKKRLEAIAAKIETKVIDDETKIDAAIDAFNDFNPIADIAKTDDTIRNLEAKAKAPTPKKDELPEPPAPPVITDDTPEWAKAMIEQNKILAQGLSALQGEKIAGTIRQKATDKLTGIPASYWGKRVLPDKEEDLEAFITDVQTDYEGFKKELTDQGLSVLPAPKGALPVDPKVVKPASKEEVAAVVKEIM
jgi:hypothetical protein